MSEKEYLNLWKSGARLKMVDVPRVAMKSNANMTAVKALMCISKTRSGADCSMKAIAGSFHCFDHDKIAKKVNKGY